MSLLRSGDKVLTVRHETRTAQCQFAPPKNRLEIQISTMNEKNSCLLPQNSQPGLITPHRARLYGIVLRALCKDTGRML
jgi:hypothetical protein